MKRTNLHSSSVVGLHFSSTLGSHFISLTISLIVEHLGFHIFGRIKLFFLKNSFLPNFLFDIISYIFAVTIMVSIFEVALLIVFRFLLFSTFLVQAIHHCYVPSFNFASHFVAGPTYPLLWCLANIAKGYEAASSNISTLF